MTFTDTSSHFPLAPGTMLRWFRSPLSICVPALPPKLQSLLSPCRAEARSQPCLHSCLHICEVSWGSPRQALARGHPSQKCLSPRKGLQKVKLVWTKSLLWLLGAAHNAWWLLWLPPPHTGMPRNHPSPGSVSNATFINHLTSQFILLFDRYAAVRNKGNQNTLVASCSEVWIL